MSNSMPEPSTLIFIHLPKTAGTTFASILEQRYPRWQVHHLVGTKGRHEFESLPDAEKRRYRVLHGHFHFGLHAHLSQPSTYVTILREPVERIISTYYFAREHPHIPLYEWAQQLPLDEFAVSDLDGRGLQNIQTRMQSGIEEAECAREMLELAKSNLANHFALVGLTERFDETVMLAKRACNWSWPFYWRRNPSKRPRRDEISERVLDVVREHNQFDTQLYEYSHQLFDEQMRQQPPTFQRKVETFRRINKLYGIPFNVAFSVIRRLT